MAARIFAQLAIGALALTAACHDSPTAAARKNGAQSVRLSLAASVVAAPGAIIEAVASYTPASGTRVIIARDSTTTDTGGPDASFGVTGDISPCLLNAETSGAACTVDLEITLKRDGRMLDQATRQFQVDAITQTIEVTNVQLFEVSTVTIDPTGTDVLEPGDTKTLVVVGRDRTGVVVAGRNITWTMVSGGITLSAAGVVTVVSDGPARVSATLGGRTGELLFQVRPPSVASLDIAPLDTAISVGGTAAYRVVARGAAGQVLTGRTITYTSSSLAVATMVGNVATGVAAGQTTITARSTEGRAGAIITRATPLRVLATAPILVDRNAVTIDVAPGVPSALTNIAVTTDAGRSIRGLVAAVTYTPNVTPWLTAALVGTVTPTTLALRASPGALDTGVYTADVQLTSTLDPHVPAAVRVTMRVVRIVAEPPQVNLGPYTPNQTQVTPFTATVRTSLVAAPFSGLTVRVEYLSSVSAWLTATLLGTTAQTAVGLTLTPNPVGVPSGVHQARVIVSATAPVASSDTILVDMTVGLPGRFSGLVLNAQNRQPISGATVTIRRLDNTLADQVTTSVSGTWTSNQLLAGTYNVTYSNTGFQDNNLFAQVLPGGVSVPVTPLPTALLIPVGAGTGRILGEVRDATTNGAVPTATVVLRAGANNLTGTPIATVQTTANGTYTFTAQPTGTYTVAASKTGFTPGSVTVTVLNVDVQAPFTFLSPAGSTIAWRFVLSWGSAPSDLDAHLTGPFPASAARFHVYWDSPGSATQSPFAELDVDARFGFGPETITLTQQIPGVYRFFVDNFSGESPLSASAARVDVYQGNTLVQQFFPPQQSGNFWTVFEINGSVLTPINVINSVLPQLRAPAEGLTRTNTKAAKALDELLSLAPWTWTKPTGPIRR